VGEIRQALDSGQNYRGQILNYRKDGSTFWNLLTLSPVRNAEGAITHFVGVQNDISEFRELLAQNSRLTFSVQHDPLTGLLNRAALEDHLLRLVARKNRQGGGFIVGILDLDDFKPVNDTFGHSAGDTLLQELARRLSDTIRSHDFIARLGGDEFALVIEDIVNPTTPEFHAFLDRLRQTIETPFEILPGRMTHMGLSLGVAFYPSDALDPEMLLREADRALCHIKEKKLAREKWWHLAGDPDVGSSSREIDAYDDQAKALLEKYAESIDPAVERFVEAFYVKLDGLPESRTILEALGEEGRRILALRQCEHLRFLLSPRTEREAILSRAKIVGQIHCLSGISNSLLVAGMNLYRKLLASQIHRGLVPDRDRTKILTIADQRIEDHIRMELESEIATIGRYMEATLAELPMKPSQDACPEIDLLQSLPGVLGIFYLSLPPQSRRGVILASSGHQRETLASLFEEAYDRETLQEISTLRTRSLQNPALPQSFRRLAQTNVRSILEIPVRHSHGSERNPAGSSGQYDHWLVVAGEHIHQFNSSWARQFAHSLRQKIEKRL
jgi:diguanylate cyclase (GGDEF)-like protein